MAVKKYWFAVAAALLFVSQPLWAGNKKIIVFDNSISKRDSRAEVERFGGVVSRQFTLINAIAAEFPPDRAAQIEWSVKSRQLRGAVSIEDDKYRIWLQDEPSFPSVASVLKQARQYAEEKKGSPLSRDEYVAPDPEIPWGIARVEAYKVWDRLDGTGVKVAVLDTGVTLKHPDLKSNIAASYNAVKPGDSANDDNGHGTHVAGTIAARRNHDGVVGVAPKAAIYAVKVLDEKGGGDSSTLIAGMEWAVSQKVQVINLSLGSKESSEAMLKAVDAVYDAGVTIVCAAGNDWGGPVLFPAAYPNAIAVSAETYDSKLSWFSNVGPEVDFIAPGEQIYSTVLDGGYDIMDGTSMACPHVAGLAALAVSAGAKNPAEVRAMLEKAAQPVPGLDATQQGKGLISAARL